MEIPSTRTNRLKFSILCGCLGLATAATAADLFEPYYVIETGSWPEAVAIGDVNSDGLADVVLVTSYYLDPENDFKLFVFLQDSHGDLMSPLKYPTNAEYTARAESIDIGDVNGDGRNDIVLGIDRKAIDVYLQTDQGQL